MKHAQTRRRTFARPTPHEFIQVWQTSRTLREACTRLRMKRSVARLRAQRYRRRGVPLKKHELEQGVELLPDWKELAEYAARLVPPGDVASGKDGDQERDDEDGGAEEGAA